MTSKLFDWNAVPQATHCDESLIYPWYRLENGLWSHSTGSWTPTNEPTAELKPRPAHLRDWANDEAMWFDAPYWALSVCITKSDQYVYASDMRETYPRMETVGRVPFTDPGGIESAIATRPQKAQDDWAVELDDAVGELGRSMGEHADTLIDGWNERMVEAVAATKDEPDDVNHPTHYTQGDIECIDAIKAATVGKSGIEAVCVANVLKYLWRYEEKNGAQDVEKAKWYLNRLLQEIGQ